MRLGTWDCNVGHREDDGRGDVAADGAVTHDGCVADSGDDVRNRGAEQNLSNRGNGVKWDMQ